MAHTNVSSYLIDRAEAGGELLAVAVARRDGGFDELTAAELNARCDRLAQALGGLGVEPGVPVALMVPPTLDFFALVFALLRLRAVPVLVDPGLGPKRIGRCFSDARPAVFIGVARAQLGRLLFGWGRESVREVVTVGGWRFFGGHSLARLERQARDEPYRSAPTVAGDRAAILFTSGSTGPPKGAVYTHGMFAEQVEVLRRSFGIEPGERDLATFPLFALFGPALGMASVVPDMDTSRPAQADPAKLLQALDTYRCTNLFASPALVDRLGRYCERNGRRLTGLRRAISAGAPVPARVVERFAALLEDGAELFTPYGATECLPIANIGSAALRETRQRTENGGGVCVGAPVESVEVTIIAVTDEPIPEWLEARPLPTGEIGEIVVRGPLVSREYAGRPDADAAHKIRDGGGVWHRTGDVGYLDAQGRLWMCGRKRDRVEALWGTLYSVPCEAVFDAHPAVRRSALVAVPQTDRMEPVLCVELEPEHRGAAEEALRRELLELGGRHEHTSDIRRILFHPGFPVDVRHNAKIDRQALARWARAM